MSVPPISLLKIGPALSDHNRYLLGISPLLRDGKSHHRPMAIEIIPRIKDEIPQAIENWLPLISLHWLSGMRMVAHQTISTCIYQLTGLIPLTGCADKGLLSVVDSHKAGQAGRQSSQVPSATRPAATPVADCLSAARVSRPPPGSDLPR